MTIKQCKFRTLYFLLTLRRFPFLITESEKCYYEKQNIQWKHYSNVLKLLQQLQKFTIQHKVIIRFRLVVFLFKNVNVFNLSPATKNLKINYNFFVKTTCYLLIGETRRQWLIFASQLLLYQTNIDIL